MGSWGHYIIFVVLWESVVDTFHTVWRFSCFLV